MEKYEIASYLVEGDIAAFMHKHGFFNECNSSFDWIEHEGKRYPRTLIQAFFDFAEDKWGIEVYGSYKGDLTIRLRNEENPAFHQNIALIDRATYKDKRTASLACCREIMKYVDNLTEK